MTVSSRSQVVGLRAGAVANRQITIYDKRAKASQAKKLGWLTIWNAARATSGKAAFDLACRDQRQARCFEMRLGGRHLRNRFNLRTWQDIHNMIGDTFTDTDALGRLRYCITTADPNRSRGPVYELRRKFEDAVGNDLLLNCAGALPRDLSDANQSAKMRKLDAQISGLFITRAANL